MTVEDDSASRAHTRRLLLEAGWVEFCAHGIAGASIGAICTRAGFTRGAFYSNFTSKEELFCQLYDADAADRAQRLAAGFERMREPASVEQSLSTQWIVRAMLEAFTAEHDDDAQWALLVAEIRAGGMRDRQLGAVVAAAEAAFHQKLAVVVADELERLGLVLNMPVLDAVALISGLYESMINSSLLREDYRPARRKTIDLLPRLLEPLVRVHPDASTTAAAALHDHLSGIRAAHS